MQFTSYLVVGSQRVEVVTSGIKVFTCNLRKRNRHQMKREYVKEIFSELLNEHKYMQTVLCKPCVTTLPATQLTFNAL